MQLYQSEDLPHNPHIIQARQILVINNFFLGAMAAGMPLVRVPENHPHNPCNTMATDGRSTFYSSDFVDKLTKAERVGVLAHETLHKFFKHHLRMGTRQPLLWNIACDFAINGILKENGFTLPADALHDDTYKGWAAEQIYDHLMKTARKVKAQGWGQVSKPTDGQGNDLSQVEMDAMGREVDMEAQRGYAMAKKQGNVPGYLEQWIKDFSESKVDYRDLVPKYITGGRSPTNYTMKKFNRRAWMMSGMLMPTMEDLHAGCIVCSVDTSGSVSDTELRHFLGEISAAHKQFRPERLIVLQCDHEVSQVDDYGPDDDFVEVKVKGRGGTSFIPPFRWLEKNGIIPDAHIYLTDGECDSFPPIPNYPMLWVTSRPFKPPFGEVARIDVHHD